MIVTLDFETYFDSKDYTLSKMGPIEYVRHPRFQVLCLGYRVNSGDTVVVEASDAERTLRQLDVCSPDTYLVGHNIAGFDALILSERFGLRPRNIIDTMHLARWCGISRVTAESHKALTDFLGHGIKKEGTVVSNGKRTKEAFTPEEWEFFKQYCADDVTQCSENFFSMVQYITQDALKFGSLTARMATEPVIRIDSDMITQYVRDIDKHAEEIMADLNHEFHFASREEFLKAIRSAPQFCEMLARYGAQPPMKLSAAKTETRRNYFLNAAMDARNRGLDDSLFKAAANDKSVYEVYSPALSKTDLDFKAMANDPNEHVAALVQARLELNSSIEKSRAVRLLEMSISRKPLPVMLKAFYAHTGRYGAGSSEGSDALNMQNMSKRDPNKLTLRRALQAPAGYKFVSVDSSQIEARMLAYLAGEEELVGHFRDGRDPYAELAEKIFGVPAQEIHDGAKGGDKKLKNYRNVGKTAILSAGYGVGWKKFSDTLLRQGVMLDKNLASHEELAKSAHQIYRMSNRNIVAFWDKCQHVIEALERGAEGWFGGPNGAAFHYLQASMPEHDEKFPCVNISGSEYKLWYPNLHWEKGEKRVEYFYDRPRGKNIIKTKLYGGALTENCCSRGTLVLTSNGWKPIETVSTDDLVYDGSEFVRHSGVVSRGVQDCIEVNGCWFTSDHLLMENGEWCYAKDCKRPDRVAVWEANSHMSNQLSEPPVALGVSMRLRSAGREGRQRSSEGCEAWKYTAVPCMCKKSTGGQAENTWHDENSHICSLALYGAALHRAYASSLGTLRRAWHNSMRALEKVREFLGGYGSNISARFGFRQAGQQCWIFAGELPLGNIQGKCEERTIFTGSRCARSVPADRDKHLDHILQACSRLACGTDSGDKAGQVKRKVETGWAGAKRTEVFDILNCGKRRCFTVMGNYPMLAHNCTQSISFMLLMWQACRMDELGIHIVANIHDAWLACVPEKEAEATKTAMEYVMSQVPDWLAGFPVACEGEIGDSYEIA